MIIKLLIFFIFKYNMSKSLFNLYNNIELFEDKDTDDQDKVDPSQTDEQTDEQSKDESGDDSGDDGDDDNLGDEDKDDDGDKDTDEDGDEDEDKDDDEDKLGEDEDEVDEDPDDDELNADKQEFDDMMDEDEVDDDELLDEDINALLDGQFALTEKDDVIDDEKFVPPVINKASYLDAPDKDEKLTDMGIDEDGDEDNLFLQGGTNGQKALDGISQMETDGDELANLILEVPIAIIEMLIDLTLKLIGAVLEGPILAIDSYLEPIRNALKGLYNILQPVVLLANNIIGLPFALGTMAWSTLCNILKLFGINVRCSANYQPNDFIIDFFNKIADVNPFRFKDMFYSEEFKESFFAAIKMLVKKVIETFVLILKVINLLTKIIEYLLNSIKQVIELTKDVTNPDNLKGFMVVCVILVVFYASLFGLKNIIGIYQSIKEKFFS